MSDTIEPNQNTPSQQAPENPDKQSTTADNQTLSSATISSLPMNDSVPKTTVEALSTSPVQGNTVRNQNPSTQITNGLASAITAAPQANAPSLSNNAPQVKSIAPAVPTNNSAALTTQSDTSLIGQQNPDFSATLPTSGPVANSTNPSPAPGVPQMVTGPQLSKTLGATPTQTLSSDTTLSKHNAASSSGNTVQPSLSEVVSSTTPGLIAKVALPSSANHVTAAAPTLPAAQPVLPATQVTTNSGSATIPPVQSTPNAQKFNTTSIPNPGSATTAVPSSIASNGARQHTSAPLQVSNRPSPVGPNILPPSMRPMTTPAAQAQAQYNLALQARAAAMAAQGQTLHTQQQYIRTQPVSTTPRPLNTYAKTESQAPVTSMGLEPMKIDSASKDVIDEAESERTRLENRERKKRWREANEDRNKDNDLRCRVNKRAHKLYGKEPSKAKDLWIEEEFSKRKSKRQEKEGKGPDGNLLIEGTDLTSLNHFEMNSVIMSTLSEFATNPAAPALKDNPDLNSMLHKLRTDPQAIRALFTGQPKPNTLPPPLLAPGSNALTSDNMQKMDAQNGVRQASSALDEDEDDEDKFSQNGSITNSVVDMTAGMKDVEMKNGQSDMQTANTANVSTSTLAQSANSPSARRFSTTSNDGTSQHLTYGIGSGFEPQVALALSSELFRLISMQPSGRKPGMHTEPSKDMVAAQTPMPTPTATPMETATTTAPPRTVQEPPTPVIHTVVKQEIQA
ncbi:protein of unknown function [Taphrina deformans PYCC 5710]|uniref:DUF3020 domain-containing protein n=1 Tax=Taphrina deformans (strain PYCC 5710 / ATCC 11124 / CBS 356.35 / IMI 108563 / JCM 9778 / NBRC 8474) TaxID=1097556 RepID=R4XKN5_TAPDE|nr:protein of unknown function [Taphrina deformans PYCC 5710]|eukprot:CCG83879.1 protein of unknown function [Taphrina deformans PYCC 5710]